MDAVTASDMLEEFRLMEGTLFQDEEVKLFYLDVKGVVLDSLIAAWDKFSTSDVLFQTALDRYYAWEGAVGHEEVERCHSDIHNVSDRHFHAAVFYSRQLYGNEDFNQKIVIAKPKIEVLLKTLFRRLVRNIHLKSGAFFSFDPIKQDFIMRDAFRQALAESIKIVDISTKKKHKEEEEEQQVMEDKGIVETNKEEEDLKQDLKEDEDKKDEKVSKQNELVEMEKEEVIVEEKIVDLKKEEIVKEEEEDFDVKKVPEDFNVGDSISVFLDHNEKQQEQNVDAEKEKEESKPIKEVHEEDRDDGRRSVLKIPTMVRTVFLS